MTAMKLPIRITITAVFIVFITTSVSLVAFTNYTESRSGILDTARELIAHSAEIAEQSIEQLIGRARIISQATASLPKSFYNHQYPVELQTFLSQALEHDPEIYGVFVGFPNGAFVQAINLIDSNGKHRSFKGVPDHAVRAIRAIGPATGNIPRKQIWRYFDQAGTEVPADRDHTEALSSYDPRKRPWFASAIENDKTMLSKVYVFSSLKQPGVTISTPVRNLRGAVVGIDLPLTDIAELTKRISPGNNGVVAIVDTDGDMVAYPDPTKIIKHRTDNQALEINNIANIADNRLQAAATKAARSGQTDISFTVDNKDYIAFFKTVGQAAASSNWQIISIASVDDFTARLVNGLERSILFAAIILLIAVGGIAILANWISAPVIELCKMADRITALNLSDSDSVSSPFDEIRRLHQSMGRMRGALDTFLRYVPRELVRNLIVAGQAASVGGSKREVTLLFTDIEGFTSLTERMTSEQVLSQTSMYFEQMSFAIQANRGTIDKFIGDAIMAMWNAPADDELHVDNACRGALTAYHVSEDLNADLSAKGLPVMRTRFGLHTGVALVGNMGARDRLQYTCLGSNVNLAARIEGINKYFGTQVLVSGAVRKKASSDFLFRRVDIVEAKGTTVPLTIFELMGERGKDAAFYVGEEKIRQASRYEQAFDLYLHQDFESAAQILKVLHQDAPDDQVVQVLQKKCQQLISTPPPNSWNGVTAMDK
jgi:adenylate cyclase